MVVVETAPTIVAAVTAAALLATIAAHHTLSVLTTLTPSQAAVGVGEALMGQRTLLTAATTTAVETGDTAVKAVATLIVTCRAVGAAVAVTVDVGAAEVKVETTADVAEEGTLVTTLRQHPSCLWNDPLQIGLRHPVVPGIVCARGRFQFELF